MDEDKLHKAIKLGNSAQGMLGGGKIDPLSFNDAIARAREELMDTWKKSKSADERDRIWVTVHLLERIPDFLNTVASNGRVAQGDIERLLKRVA